MSGVAMYTDDHAAAGSAVLKVLTAKPGLHLPRAYTTWPRDVASGSSTWTVGPMGLVVPQNQSCGRPRVMGCVKLVTCMKGPQGLSLFMNVSPVRSAMLSTWRAGSRSGLM